MPKPERLTTEPVSAEVLRTDVNSLFEYMAREAIGIVPLDVAYAVCATRDSAIRRIFAAKNRSYDKPSGMLANSFMSREIHLMDQWRHDLVQTIVDQANVPFSVVAPFRADHPLLRGVDAFVMRSSTKGQTLDMLLNAGQFHDEIARQAWERQIPVFGSSANTSLAGSKFRYRDIEAPVRAAAEVYFDYGKCVYANAEGRSSTIIDFQNFSVIRIGTVFDRVQAAFRDIGDVQLKVAD